MGKEKKENNSLPKRMRALNLEVLLQEIKPKSQVKKLVTILEVYAERVTLAEARIIFEVINDDEFPTDFFFSKPSVATIIGCATNNSIELKWRNGRGKKVYLKDVYFPDEF